MMRRVAEADAVPVPTDAPEQEVAAVPYDPGLQQELVEFGPDALKEYGVIVVRGVGDSARYNTAVWYALAQDPILHYELKNGCVYITDPNA